MRTVHVEAKEKSKVTRLAQILHLCFFEDHNWGAEVNDVPQVSQLVSGTPGQIQTPSRTAPFRHEHGTRR